jgi:hypothetical protein
MWSLSQFFLPMSRAGIAIRMESGAEMPKVFEKDGYKFSFYSNEHRPIHVHVRCGGGEAVFEVENQVELRESYGLKVGQLARAQRLAEENRDMIIEKWHEFFN